MFVLISPADLFKLSPLLLIPIRRTVLENIHEVIQRMRQHGPHRHKLTEAALACAWKELMPLAVQKRTTQTFYKRGKFFVQLNSAPLRQELQANSNKVCTLLQQHVPDCSALEVVFL